MRLKRIKAFWGNAYVKAFLNVLKLKPFRLLAPAKSTTIPCTILKSHIYLPPVHPPCSLSWATFDSVGIAFSIRWFQFSQNALQALQCLVVVRFFSFFQVCFLIECEFHSFLYTIFSRLLLLPLLFLLFLLSSSSIQSNGSINIFVF